MDEIQTQVLRVFLLAIQSHLLQLCLEISISSNSRNLLQVYPEVAVHCKGEKEENLIENHTYGLRNPYKNLKSEKSQDYVHEFGFWRGDARCPVMELQ